jgi:hypothetical protein
MVSVLAIGTYVSGLKPGRGNGFLRAIKIHRTPSLGGGGGGEKPEAPRRKILRHLKITCNYELKYFARPNSSFTFPFLLLATR